MRTKEDFKQELIHQLSTNFNSLEDDENELLEMLINIVDAIIEIIHDYFDNCNTAYCKDLIKKIKVEI